ncbi:unnamed protein product [Vitrella brassicaformis CCMP3155]|uniref:Uncharacterized protein n=2 Tax=Vitrella brassicaformis TaxID=1169539 RepID=A0A0G4G2I0_VITBC|nr:unnamed protein product [Vitrella brassicaformis CCMP3155]|mmetsp:Transcript_48009/g.120188  ORF Transcript_48009/g.120188 Transcript_48009/m.120188 type:complete len:309 (+) Transcript_48009:146-1072(+)|eukprot:CEM22473.1 unnamed protein product [Vitrella brassicaformis CCMP3155]
MTTKPSSGRRRHQKASVNDSFENKAELVHERTMAMGQFVNSHPSACFSSAESSSKHPKRTRHPGHSADVHHHTHLHRHAHHQDHAHHALRHVSHHHPHHLHLHHHPPLSSASKTPPLPHAHSQPPPSAGLDMSVKSTKSSELMALVRNMSNSDASGSTTASPAKANALGSVFFPPPTGRAPVGLGSGSTLPPSSQSDNDTESVKSDDSSKRFAASKYKLSPRPEEVPLPKFMSRESIVSSAASPSSSISSRRGAADGPSGADSSRDETESQQRSGNSSGANTARCSREAADLTSEEMTLQLKRDLMIA